MSLTVIRQTKPTALDEAQLTRAGRVIYLCLLLAFMIAMQSVQTAFINPAVVVPSYLLVSVSMLLSALVLLLEGQAVTEKIIEPATYAYDALMISSLILITQANHPLFISLYVVNIILCGMRYSKKNAVLLALWTSSLFSLLLSIGPQIEGANLYFALVLNNAAFFIVAGASGYVMDQFRNLKFEVKESHKSIETLQDLNNLIVDNIASGLITVDSGWQIVQGNNSAAKILGFDQLENLSLKEVFFADFDKIRNLINESKDKQKRLEISHRNTRGENQVLEIVVSDLYESSKQFKGYAILIQDLTKIKKYEKMLQQKEKLAAVGQLAAGIAHEIRNPLASISGSIQLLGGSETGTEENKKLVNITLKEIDRLNLLISDFLEYVRPEEKSNEIFNVNDVLEDVCSMVKFNSNLNQQVEQKKSFSAKLFISGDRDKLKQAFLNIVINAYQSMEKNSAGRLNISTFDDANRVIVEIQDDGEGIDKENLNRIFEPFHTTKHKGTGLGLAMTHKILELHDAEIEIESEKHKGTKFILSFPAINNPLGGEAKVRKGA